MKLPRLEALGLGQAMKASTGRAPPGFALPEPRGQWGFGIETSRGKDTPSGHWELAGTPVDFDWGYFPETIPALPGDADRRAHRRRQACRDSRQPPRLGHGGDRGLRRGAPANAEAHLLHLRRLGPPDRRARRGLRARSALRLCRIARRLCDPLNIGRVIARPFVGASAKDFVRTANRKDFAVSPPDGNLLQRAARAGRAVVSIGKIGDIFAHRDTGDERKGKSNDGNVDLLIDALTTTADGGLIFVNLVDFDTEWGHRRDVPGYAACLEAFDARLGAIEAAMRPHRLLRHHRRPRQRSDLPRLRPHARACADPRLRRRRSRRARSARAQASPTSQRRSRSNSACRADRMGPPGPHENRHREERSGRGDPGRRALLYEAMDCFAPLAMTTHGVAWAA